MPTIEEVIAKLKENDTEAAGVVEGLLQAHDNFKTQSRRWEDQAKQNKLDAEKFRNGESATADLEKELEDVKSQLAAKDTALSEKEQKLSEYETKEARTKLIEKVANDKGIPSKYHDYLRGETEEELQASADKLKTDFKFGNVDEFGSDNKSSNPGTLAAGEDLYDEFNNKK